MEDIKMADEKALYAKLKPELDDAFSAVMESMAFEDGPQVQQFAKSLEQYQQVPYAVPCANGTLALQIALLALELPAGAAVILPAFSYEAGAELVARLGLKPVFADVHPATFTLDPAAVEKAINPDTAVVIPVHLFGQCADMDALMALAKQEQLRVVEDNTQAFGAVYKGHGQQVHKAGSMGHIGVTSFFPTKPLGGMGEGGVVLTKDRSMARKAETMVGYGQSESPEMVINAKLATLQAAILDVKIKHISAYSEARREVAGYYDKAFGDTPLVQVPHTSPNSTHVYQQYTIKVPAHLRDGLQQHLQKNYIPSVVYYPQPLHLKENFAYLGYKAGDLPVSEMLSQSVLSLPMHTELKQEQLAYICQHVINYVKQYS